MFKSGSITAFAVVEKPVEVPDDQGGSTNRWEEVGRTFIRVQPMGAYERVAHLRQQMKVSHWVTFRNPYFEVTNAMRIRVLQDDVVPAPPVTPLDRVFLINPVVYRRTVLDVQP
jgi:head-tail adaptor